jgi:hypothetical protein
LEHVNRYPEPDMIQRISLFVASLAAVTVLVIGMVAVGIDPSQPQSSDPSGRVAGSAEPLATPKVQVDTVYVPPPQTPATVVVHRSIPAPGGEREAEGGD